MALELVHQDSKLTSSSPMDRHPAAVYLARLAPGSRRTMRTSLDTIAGIVSAGQCNAEILPWASLRYQHTQAIRTAVKERYAAATANKALAALRGVLTEAWRLGQICAEDYRRAADLSSVRGETLPRGRALSTGELRVLFEACACDLTPAGRRDAALIAILYGGGLRRSEVAGLDLSDYAPGTGALRVRQGKGRKERIVYVTNGGHQALEAWLRARGDSPGSLFHPIDKAGHIHPRPLTDQVVLRILRKRATEAGVGTFSPHDLRRTFISDLLDAGADIATVQRLAGHSNVQTTARYDRRGEVSKQKASGMLHVPYAAPHGRGE